MCTPTGNAEPGRVSEERILHFLSLFLLVSCCFPCPFYSRTFYPMCEDSIPSIYLIRPSIHTSTSVPGKEKIRKRKAHIQRPRPPPRQLRPVGRWAGVGVREGDDHPQHLNHIPPPFPFTPMLGHNSSHPIPGFPGLVRWPRGHHTHMRHFPLGCCSTSDTGSSPRAVALCQRSSIDAPVAEPEPFTLPLPPLVVVAVLVVVGLKEVSKGPDGYVSGFVFWLG